MSELRLVARERGCALVTEDGHAIHTMSWMDAARTLWNLKDGLRASRIGRGCVDDVHSVRTGGPRIRTDKIGRYS